VDARLTLSVVVPVLNEAARVREALGALAALRARGHEVIVVDGGSDDGSAALAAPLCDRLLRTAPGRARQMNAGARAARGEALVFLHADTRLPDGADALILAALRERSWGRFDVAIDSRRRVLKIVACAINLRSRLSGIATGDQAIFVRRDAFPGFPEIALMEDVAFSQAMKTRERPACVRARAITSGRRWEAGGVLRTVLLMWRLRLLYAAGRSPERLAREYPHRR
jgi:rSAM/selenodomain-associated transferase 2